VKPCWAMQASRRFRVRADYSVSTPPPAAPWVGLGDAPLKVATTGLQRRVETRAHLHVDARVVLEGVLERVAVEMVRAAITPRLYLPRPGEGTLGKVSAARMAEKGTRALNPLATRRYGEAPSVRKGWVAPRTEWGGTHKFDHGLTRGLTASFW